MQDDFPLSELKQYSDNIITGSYDKVETKQNQLLRCYKVRIIPTRKQRLIIRNWYKWYKWSYNQAVKYLRNQEYYGQTLTINYNKLRDATKKFRSKRVNKSTIPRNTMDNAVKDVITAYKSALANKRAGNIKHFRLRYKKASKPNDTIVLEPGAFSSVKNAFATNTLNIIKSSKPIKKENIKHASRLQLERYTGHMILHVPEHRCKKTSIKEDWCSLDPGLRTFQTLYSPNQVSEFGTTQKDKLDKIITKIERVKEYKQESWYKKYTNKRYAKMQNIMADLHWKTALSLVKNYKTILIGNMSTKSIVRKESNLSSQNKRIAMMMSHGLFNQRIKHKAEEYGSTIIMVNEAYTSMTCGDCGKRNRNLGGAKIYKCTTCPFTWGRDFNGARNIALNYFNQFESYD